MENDTKRSCWMWTWTEYVMSSSLVTTTRLRLSILQIGCGCNEKAHLPLTKLRSTETLFRCKTFKAEMHSLCAIRQMAKAFGFFFSSIRRIFNRGEKNQTVPFARIWMANWMEKKLCWKRAKSPKSDGKLCPTENERVFFLLLLLSHFCFHRSNETCQLFKMKCIAWNGEPFHCWKSIRKEIYLKIIDAIECILIAMRFGSDWPGALINSMCFLLREHFCWRSIEKESLGKSSTGRKSQFDWIGNGWQHTVLNQQPSHLNKWILINTPIQLINNPIWLFSNICPEIHLLVSVRLSMQYEPSLSNGICQQMNQTNNISIVFANRIRLFCFGQSPGFHQWMANTPKGIHGRDTTTTTVELKYSLFRPFASWSVDPESVEVPFNLVFPPSPLYELRENRQNLFHIFHSTYHWVSYTSYLT